MTRATPPHAHRGDLPRPTRAKRAWYGTDLDFQGALLRDIDIHDEHAGLITETLTGPRRHRGRDRVWTFNHVGLDVPGRMDPVRVRVKFRANPAYPTFGLEPYDFPLVFADPGAESKHRHHGIDALCLWFPGDPVELRWHYPTASSRCSTSPVTTCCSRRAGAPPADTAARAAARGPGWATRPPTASSRHPRRRPDGGHHLRRRDARPDVPRARRLHLGAGCGARCRPHRRHPELRATLRANAKNARRQTLTTLYGDALGAVSGYLEGPYRVLRKDGEASTRFTLTSGISDLKTTIGHHQALMRLHADPVVADAYDHYVAVARPRPASRCTSPRTRRRSTATPTST